MEQQKVKELLSQNPHRRASRIEYHNPVPTASQEEQPQGGKRPTLPASPAKSPGKEEISISTAPPLMRRKSLPPPPALVDSIIKTITEPSNQAILAAAQAAEEADDGARVLFPGSDDEGDEIGRSESKKFKATDETLIKSYRELKLMLDTMLKEEAPQDHATATTMLRFLHPHVREDVNNDAFTEMRKQASELQQQVDQLKLTLADTTEHHSKTTTDLVEKHTKALLTLEADLTTQHTIYVDR